MNKDKKKVYIEEMKGFFKKTSSTIKITTKLREINKIHAI